MICEAGHAQSDWYVVHLIDSDQDLHRSGERVDDNGMLFLRGLTFLTLEKWDTFPYLLRESRKHELSYRKLSAKYRSAVLAPKPSR